MAKYMLLLKGDTTRMGDRDLSPEEIQAIIRKYIAWSTELEERGHWLASDKLRTEPARALTAAADGVRVMDGPFSEAKEVVAGYFMIEARDMDEAEAIARGCPHLGFGGAIEIREVESRPGEHAPDRERPA